MNAKLILSLLCLLFGFPFGSVSGAPASQAASSSASGPAFEVPPLPANWDGGFYAPAPNVEPHPLRGVYAIWYTNMEEVLDLPFLKGGQVMEQWATIEPEEGKYDFSAVDKKLDELATRGFSTTIQINGNNKPEWLFKKVPYYPVKFHAQVSDKQGTIMYWHPEFVKSYFNFVDAFAEYVKKSPHRERILGIRMNFNSIGTEMTDIPPEARSEEGWIIPDGVEKGPFPWTFKTGEEYMEKVVDKHVQVFDGITRIFVRSYVGPGLKKKYQEDFNSGRLSWFFTGMSHTVFKWRSSFPPFLLDCRTGETLGYGEPGSNAWGHRTESRKPREIPPVSANYWQMLLEMHLGVSFIACYGSDLLVAHDGRLPGPPNPIAKTPATMPADGQFRDAELKDEFYKAFEFAAKYAGYHASPTVSPGAWIALRQVSESDDRHNTWDVMSNDCTFLMKRLPDNTIGTKNIGPEDQRFSAYARELPADETMRFVLDPLFSRSIKGKKVKLNVTYFDGEKGSLLVKASGETFELEMKGTGRWQSASFEISSAMFAGEDKEGDIQLTAGGESEVMLHMVELTRE